MSCVKCDLYKTCTSVCVPPKVGEGLPRIMLVLDYPDKTDNRFGKTFSGDAYKKLLYYCDKLNIPVEDIYITYAVKCMPPQKKVKKAHYETCRDNYLMREIIKYRPEIIIASGSTALKSLTGDESVFDYRGFFRDFKVKYDRKVGNEVKNLTFTTKLIPTYSFHAAMWEWTHDIYILHDLEKVKKALKTKTFPLPIEPKFQTVDTGQKLKDFYELMMDTDIKYCATDFETTGFDFWRHRIINSGYCLPDEQIFVVPQLEYRKKEFFKKWTVEELERAKHINAFVSKYGDQVRKVLKKVHAKESIKWILHNGKFDQKFATSHGMPFYNFYFDTMLADSLIDENRSHSLNVVAEFYGHDFGPYDTYLWPYIGKNEKVKKSYQHAPIPMLEKYLAIDTLATKRIFVDQIKMLKDEDLWNHFIDLKMVSLRQITKSEFKGVKADRKFLLESQEKLVEEIKNIEVKARELVGNEKFNLSSPKQVMDYFKSVKLPFDKLGITKTKTGYSTDAENLRKISKVEKYKELPELLLRYASLTKMTGTYLCGDHTKPNDVGGMLQYLDKNERIHGNYNLHTAVTGRQSCIRKGSYVDVVRDLSKEPKGIKIEDVKVGDLVYCYNHDGELAISRVNAFYDNGKKEIYRLFYKSTASKRIGYLDLTPDHKVRVWDGSYIRCDELKENQRILFMERQISDGYSKIVYKNSYSEFYDKWDHRFIMKSLGHNTEGLVVHHKDENKLNNNTSNLEIMTKSEHSKHHLSLKAPQVNGNVKKRRTVRKTYVKPLYSRLGILREIVKCSGKLKQSKHDYYTVIRQLAIYKIKISDLRLRFSSDGKVINKNMVIMASTMTIDQACKFLKKGCESVYELFKIYDVPHVKQNKKPPRSKANLVQYKKHSKIELLKAFCRCEGILENNDIYLTRKVFAKQLKSFGFNFKEKKFRFYKGKYYNRNILEKYNRDSLLEPSSALGLPRRRYVRALQSYNINIQHNHYVLKVEKLGVEDNVYCLGVEEYNNFIVEELCVSNCNSPSLQVWPRSVKGLPNIRNCLIPSSPDHVFFEADYSQLEQCVVAFLSGDPVLLQRIRDGVDLHCLNAIDLGKKLKTVDESITYAYIMTAVGKGDDVPNNPFKQAEIPKETVELLKEMRTKSKCLNGETRLYTKDGMLKISDTLIDSHTDTYWLQPIDLTVATGKCHEKAVRVNHKWVEQQYTIKAKHGSIKCNSDHPMIIWRDCKIQEVMAKDLIKGDFLIKPRKNEIWPDHDKYVELNTNIKFNRSKHTDSITLPKYLTPEIGFLYGILVAEACSTSLSLDMTKEDVTLDYVSKIYQNNFNHKPTETFYCGNMRRLGTPSLIRRFLKLNGLEKVSYAEAKVPEQIFRSPREVVRQFLIGFFEGDGSRHVVQSGSEKLRDDLVILLGNFNIFAVPFEEYHKVPTSGVIKKYYALRMESYDYAIFSGKIGYYSDRKNKKLKFEVKKDSRKLYGLEDKIDQIRSVYTNGRRTKINSENVRFGERVHSQEKCEITYNLIKKRPYVLDALKVYSEFESNTLHSDVIYLLESDSQLSEIRDISVEHKAVKNYDITIDHNDHTYVANGFLTHNSISFGLNYGKMADSFAEEFGISKFEANKMVNAYFGIYSGMYNWRNDLVEEAFTNGYVKLQSGRKRRFHQIIDWLQSPHAKKVWSADILRNEIIRQIYNFPVQGGAHEVFEPQYVNVNNKFKEQSLTSILLLYIHDGLVGECHKKDIEATRKILQETLPITLGKGTKRELTLKVDIDFYEVGACWYGPKMESV